MLPIMRTNGAAAELSVMSDLIRKGYSTFYPMMENTECDFVVQDGIKLYRVQVKSSSSDGEKLRVDITRPSAKNRHYSKDAFDILAIYDNTTKRIAYFDWSKIVQVRSITLRITETPISNGYVGENGRMYFDDYLEFPIIYETVGEEAV